MMTEDDIDKARTLMPALLDRLNREWKTWKSSGGSGPLLFDKYLLPDDPSEPPRSKGIRIRVKKFGEEALGYWRFEGGKFIFSRQVNGDGHQFAALTENEAVRWTRTLCCAPRAGLKGTGEKPALRGNSLSFHMVEVETAERIVVAIRGDDLWALDKHKGARDDGFRVLREHRPRIEVAANDKYIEEGVLGELDGQDAIWVKLSDLAGA